MANIAYVDGQNLYMSTAKSDSPWRIDLARFRVYLEKKLNVETAYYYLGHTQDSESARTLYEEIQSAGFVLVFKPHVLAMLGTKKGNVDSDIIFSIMKRLYKKENFDRVVLVSGDGDYKNLVDFLIEEGRLERILFPNRQFRSSLYRKLAPRFFSSLDESDVRAKIERENRKRGLLR